MRPLTHDPILRSKGQGNKVTSQNSSFMKRGPQLVAPSDESDK